VGLFHFCVFALPLFSLLTVLLLSACGEWLHLYSVHFYFNIRFCYFYDYIHFDLLFF